MSWVCSTYPGRKHRFSQLKMLLMLFVTNTPIRFISKHECSKDFHILGMSSLSLKIPIRDEEIEESAYNDQEFDCLDITRKVSQY